MVATLITNGYLLIEENIEKLNRAGLDRLQISIDNVNPDAISRKSLKVLDRKLLYLAELARFEININSVVGAGVERPEDALSIAKRAHELGFSATMGVIHDGNGHLEALSPSEKAIFDQFQRLNRFKLARFNKKFQVNLAEGRPNKWRCRAGSRYLYICEDGKVHYCSQQRGYPAIALEQYGKENLAREHITEKKCAPYCTIACVHQASTFDQWTAPQHAAPRKGSELIQLRSNK